MAEIIVKVVGPHVKSNIPALNIGDKLIARTKDAYKGDPTAIKLETVDGREVGFVAAQPKTAGTFPLASEVFPFVSEGDALEIKTLTPYLTLAINKPDDSGKIEKTFVLVIGGNKVEYPARLEVSMNARKHGTVPLNYKIENESIILLLGDEKVPCGVATSAKTATQKATLAAKGIEVSAAEEVLQAMQEASSVKIEAKFLDASTIPVEIKVEMEESAAVEVVANKSFDTALKEFTVFDQEEMRKRIDWLKTHGVQEYAINAFINDMQSQKNIRPFKPEYIPHRNEVENAIVIYACRGNILCTGPAGSGKNRFLETFANLYDMDIVDMSCSAGVDEESLFGYLSMKPTEEAPNPAEINAAFKSLIKALKNESIDETKFANASTEEQIKTIERISDDTDYSVILSALRTNTASIQFEPSAVTKAMEKRCIINFDEVNTLRAIVTAAFHAFLDSRRCVLINGFRKVFVHKDLLFTATMNEGNDYAGTSMLNMAFEDRWQVIEFEAPATIAEILKHEVPKLPSKAVKVLNELYKKLLSIRGVEIQERSFSQRAFINAAKAIALGSDVKYAVMNFIVPKIRDVEDQEAVKTIVDMMMK
jgi:MoxR-like ATPase